MKNRITDYLLSDTRQESVPFRVYEENGEYEVRQEYAQIRHSIKKENSTARIFTVMALSFHALFEGLAIGLETDTTDIWIMFAGNKSLRFLWLGENLKLCSLSRSLSLHSFLYYILAIATHKYVIIFCVGLELYNAGTQVRLYIVYMLIYALMSPLGIGMGIVVDVSVMHHHEHAYKATVGLLQVHKSMS